MKTVEIKLFTIKELSEESQQKAHGDFLSEDHYFWSHENNDTLKAFCDIFPVKVKDYEYGYRNYINFTFTAEDEIENLSGIKLLKYIYNNYESFLFKRKFYKTIKNHEIKHPCIKHEKLSNNNIFSAYYSRILKDISCVLTGYCIDDDILLPIYDFLKNPNKHTSFYDLIKDCLESWIQACNRDYEFSCSLEYFIEHSEANEYLYTEDGKFYS